MRNVWFAGVFSCLIVAAASCGGGGSSSSSPAVLSTYSINSNPTGLSVQVDGTTIGKTPATAAPAYAKTSHVITVIAPGSAAPYSVTIAQTASGPQQIFYNSLVDTAAKISSLTPGAIALAAPLAQSRTMCSPSSRRPSSVAARCAW